MFYHPCVNFDPKDNRFLNNSNQLDLVFNNVKPNDWYFVLDLVQVRTKLGCVRLTNQNFWLDGSGASFLVPCYSPSKS